MFLEGVFIADASQKTTPPTAAWRDASNSEYFIFESEFGAVKLRKRIVYPQTFAKIEGSKLLLGYGSPDLGAKVARQELREVPNSTFYNDEFLYIQADCSKQNVIIQRDAFSTLPLFVGRQRDRLTISNHYDKACALLGDGSLHADRIAIAETLGMLHTFDRTLVEEVRVLYDRKRLYWSLSETKSELPQDGDVVEVVKNRNGNIKEFRSRLEATLDAYWQRYASNTPVGCELSGGLDSTTVVGYYADKQKTFTTLTQRFPGNFGISQDAKLRDLAQRFGIGGRVVELDPARFYHLSHIIQPRQWRPLYQWQVDNPDVLAGLFEPLQGQGYSTIFTGTGGNELCENIPNLKIFSDEIISLPPDDEGVQSPAWADDQFSTFLKSVNKGERVVASHPLSVIPQTVAFGSARANNKFIDLFTQSLPIRYRYNRNVMRMYMAACHFPPSVYSPSVNENFEPFFKEGAFSHLGPYVDMFLKNSVLGKAGILDEGKVLSAFEQARNMTDPKQSIKVLLDVMKVLVVEMSLQSHGKQAVLL